MIYPPAYVRGREVENIGNNHVTERTMHVFLTVKIAPYFVKCTCDCSFPFTTVSIARTFRTVPTAAKLMDIIFCNIGSKWWSTFVLFLVAIFTAISANPSHISIAK